LPFADDVFDATFEVTRMVIRVQRRKQKREEFRKRESGKENRSPKEFKIRGESSQENIGESINCFPQAQVYGRTMKRIKVEVRK